MLCRTFPSATSTRFLTLHQRQPLNYANSQLPKPDPINNVLELQLERNELSQFRKIILKKTIIGIKQDKGKRRAEAAAKWPVSIVGWLL